MFRLLVVVASSVLVSLVWSCRVLSFVVLLHTWADDILKGHNDVVLECHVGMSCWNCSSAFLT